MSAKASRGRSVGIAILALALLIAALQAKLGLYYSEHFPEHSEVQLVSKAFKLSECRLARAVADPPAVTAALTLAIVPSQDASPEPEFLEYALGQPQPFPFSRLSRCHWFRPPPAHS